MSLRKKTISGLFWSVLSQGGKQVSQFVITAILARLLSPADFGLVAMATVFTGFAMIFGELGISSALIQKQDLDEDHWSSAFWLNLLVGFFLAIIFYFSAPFIALFYKKPELVSILQVLSINFILVSFTIIQQTILTKEMNFRSLMVRDILAVIVSGFLGIVLAFRGWGVWSLIVQTLTFSIVNGVLLWILSKWRPRFVFSRLAIRDIFHFSANVTGFQIINYFGRNIDQLLIGKFLGTQALGYYSLAYKLMLLPLQNISWMITRVMFPAFSLIQNDITKLRVNYLKMIKYIAVITIPLMLGLFFIAKDLVLVFYGPKWLLTVSLIQVLVFCGMVQSIGTTVGIIYQSLGRADIQFKFTLFVSVPTAVLSVLIGLRYGIVGVAIAYTLRTIMVTFISHIIANRLLLLSMREFLGSLWASVQVSFFVGLVMILLGFIDFSHSSVVLSLIVKIMVGIAAYVLTILYFKIISLENLRWRG